jgi:hypothetical protein
MRDGKQLVLIENFNPIRGKRLSWLEDPKRRTLGVNLRQPRSLVVPPAPTNFSPVFCTKCGTRHEQATCPSCGTERRRERAKTQTL